jgi:thiosulfate/3-mercaptopyruvate sulfurtransferase
MKVLKFIFSSVLFLTVTVVSAQDLISVNDLAAISKNSDVIIVYAGAEDGYKVHITGSISVPHTLLYNNEPVRALIKPADEMAKILGDAGVSPDKTIVVYDEGSNKYSARMYWMLKYLGAPNVKVLNGNLTAWKAGRKPVTGTPTKLAPAVFTAKPEATYLSNMEETRAANGNAAYVLVDARKPDEFAGTAETELRKGHIPGAINLNYELALDAKGMYKSNEELKTLFESKGITTDKTIILYCETSVRAGTLFLALKGLGYPNVKVYDGAYIEWQATSSNTVEQ